MEDYNKRKLNALVDSQGNHKKEVSIWDKAKAFDENKWRKKND